MFELYDKVRVVNDKNRLIKEGIIVELTSHGAKVYDPNTEWPFTDNVQFAEWFPFSSAKVKMLSSRSKRKRV